MTNKDLKKNTETQKVGAKKPAAFSLPEGWEEITLGEVVEIKNGGTPSTKNDKFWNGDIPWITPKDLSGYDKVFIEAGERSITKLGLENSSAQLLPKKTILFSSRAPIGYVVIAKTEMTTNQGFKNLICDEEKSHFKYFYYLMKYKSNYIEKLSSGSTFSEASASLIKSIDILLPPLSQQKAIAKMLSAFDDKIELLREQNETLEKIGETIFKEYFSLKNPHPSPLPEGEGGLPDGWRVGKLGEIANLKSGFAFKSKDFVEENNKKALKIKDLKGAGKIDLVDVSSISDEIIKSERVQYFKLKAGDIVLAMSGNTTGKIGIIPESEYEIFLNQRVGKFFLENEKLNSFLYFFLMSGNYEEIILNMGYGSAQPNISPSQIENIDLIFPDDKTLNDFLEISNNLFKKIIKNNSQIQTLAKTRDTLLPKLMKGGDIIK